MAANPQRFTVTRSSLADGDTGLEWAPAPSTLPLAWADAVATAATLGQRLPTAEELVTLLTGLPLSLGIAMPATGHVLWSSSGSPFAPETRVRAMACEGPGRFVVVLLERVDRAQWWGVRERRSSVVNARSAGRRDEARRPREQDPAHKEDES
jgi:hypothetical protein